MKTSSYLHAHFIETMEEVENLLKKAYDEKLNSIDTSYRYTLRQFQCVLTTNVSENKENYFEVNTQPSINSIAFASFKHLKIPISNKICHYTTNCLHLHASCISKFNFKNYLFVSLVVVWL